MVCNAFDAFDAFNLVDTVLSHEAMLLIKPYNNNKWNYSFHILYMYAAMKMVLPGGFKDVQSMAVSLQFWNCDHQSFCESGDRIHTRDANRLEEECCSPLQTEQYVS
jgi:hypothetical protein